MDYRSLIRRAKLLLLTLGLLTASDLVMFGTDTEAVPVQFSITLTATFVDDPFFPNPEPPCISTLCGKYLQHPEVGKAYSGSFIVDDALLSQTGTNLPGVLTSFRLQIESLVFDMSRPALEFDDDAVDRGSFFLGFRGPCATGNCIGAPSPGFDVANGTIIGLRGGVFGPGDSAFVDFGGNGFLSRDQGNILVFGTLAVARVNEPPTLVLLMIGGLIIAYVCHGRASTR